MLDFAAKRIYADASVYRQENCLQRLERVLPHIHCRDVREYDPPAREEVARIGKRRHGKDRFKDETVVVFTAFEQDRSRWHYNWRDEAEAHGGACQPGVELNLVDGCIFRCDYCGFGRKIVFCLDVEEFLQGLEMVFEKHPRQRLFKFSNTTDLPPLEPELDAIPPMIRRFAHERDRYLLLFTKSSNVGFLEGLEHGGHTIISWSLTCERVSRQVDRGTATMAERIEAMRIVERAGYKSRARLSPVIPVRNWRGEYSRLLERMFESTSPDVVTLELLGWMELEDLLVLFDRDFLDARAVEAAESCAEQLRGFRWGPFTQETHEEVYRFLIEKVQALSPGTPVSVCHGTPATWRALGPLMGMRPDSYLCNCGPDSAPGGALYEAWLEAPHHRTPDPTP